MSSIKTNPEQPESQPKTILTIMDDLKAFSKKTGYSISTICGWALGYGAWAAFHQRKIQRLEREVDALRDWMAANDHIRKKPPETSKTTLDTGR
ncbi:hypothetical protein [uncultured Roseobacter sp.]|uniref:hypothetical protein n=1 Tax=uncultured Roseobacter sp. TaxID=114847 RepID=UPI002604F2C2|nr:hypothetical protein [uncultured Roseobacter sp.]